MIDLINALLVMILVLNLFALGNSRIQSSTSMRDEQSQSPSMSANSPG